jgi:hypothetical protein
MFPDILQERDSKAPFFIGYDTLSALCKDQTNLSSRLFTLGSKVDLSSKMDLQTLKKLLLRVSQDYQLIYIYA